MRITLKFLLIVVLGISACSKSVGPVTNPDNSGQNFTCNDPDEDLYVLPYPVGQSYTLIQGNCSDSDHVNEFRYAFDFVMPIGSYITAARGVW